MDSCDSSKTVPMCLKFRKQGYAVVIYDNRNACIDCCADSFLRELIATDGTIGDCYLCDSEAVKTAPVLDLSEMFRSVAECYYEITGPDAYLPGETRKLANESRFCRKSCPSLSQVKR